MFLSCKKACFEEGRLAAPSFAFFARRLGAVVLWFALPFLTSCQKEESYNSNFVDAFVEMRVVEMTFGADSPSARILRQEIIKKHGYTREQFLAETEKLLDDERQWVVFQKAVVAQLDTLLADRKEDNVRASKSVPHSPPVKPANPMLQQRKPKGGDD